MTRLALLFTAIIVFAVTYLVIRELSDDSRKMGLRAYEPHVHEWTYVPVWKADLSEIEGWWWCMKHAPGQWVRGDDEVMAA